MTVIWCLYGWQVCACRTFGIIKRCSTLPVLVVVTGCQIHITLDIFEILCIVGIEGKQTVLILLRTILVIATAQRLILVVALCCVGRNINGSVALGIVSTHGSMEFEFWQEMNLVIYIHWTDEAAYLTLWIIQIHQTARVSYTGIHWIAVSIECLVIATIFVVAGINRDGWVECGSCPYGATIIEWVVIEGSLGIDSQLQVILEEARSQYHVTCPALYIVLANQTALVVIAYRHTEWQPLVDAAAHAEVIICTEGCTVNLIIPVGIGSTEQWLLVICTKLVDDIHKFITTQHIYHLRTGLQTVGGIEVHLYSTLLSLLGGNDNDTVRCTGTIDGCRRSILQYSHALDIRRVDHAEEVAAVTRDTTLLQWHAIEHDKRVVAGVQRCTTTHTDGTTCWGRTTVGHDLYTRNLTIDQLLRRRNETLVEVLSLHRSHGTRQVALARSTITDDHDIGKRLAIRFEIHLHIFRNSQYLIYITYIRYLDLLGRRRYLKNKVTVEISNRTPLFAFYHNGSADKRITILCICHFTLNGASLSEKLQTSHEQQCHEKETSLFCFA